MFTLKVQLTKDIYGKVSAALMVKRYLYVYIIAGIIAIALVANLLFIPGQSIEFTGFLWPIVCALIVVGHPVLQWRYGFGWRNHPTAAQLATYELSDEGVNVRGETYQTSQAWANFLSVKQFKSAVVLFFTQNQIFILPNESFASAEVRTNVVEYVRARIPLDRQRQFRSQAIKRFAIMAGVWLVVIVVVFVVLTVGK